MAEIYVKNSLNIDKSVKFNITLRYIVVKGSDYGYKWVLEIGTTHLDTNGDKISSKKIHLIDVDNFDEVIESALADLCAQIDWAPLVDDTQAPCISYTNLSDGDAGVSISTIVKWIMEDTLPGSGMDLSNMQVILNNGVVDFDITDEVVVNGDPYKYICKWVPTMRVMDTYEGD